MLSREDPQAHHNQVCFSLLHTQKSRLNGSRQGLVLEDIDSNTPEDEFKKRILSRCHTPQAGTAPVSTATIDVSQIVPESIQRAIEPEDTTAAAPPLSEVQQAADATAQPNSPTLQDILSERNARLDADHRKKREEEREAKKAAAKRAGKQREDQAAEASSVPQARQDWITQQRNRQQEARVEKERVLRAIESDKAARREREQRRRIAQSADTPAAFAPQKSDSTHGRSNPTCNLQIRLFDGSSLRSKFDSSATLATSVRTYISEQSSSDMPYNFREIRTPQPSRTIEISEENESLQSLGLTPSATLVLVPVKGYTDAYASSGAGGILSKGLNTGYGLLSGAVGFVGSAVGSVLGYGGDATLEGPYMGGTSDDLEPSNMDDGTKTTQKVTPVTAGPSSGIKIRTLADQRKEEEEEEDDGQELYNGNQVCRILFGHKSKANITNMHNYSLTSSRVRRRMTVLQMISSKVLHCAVPHCTVQYVTVPRHSVEPYLQ